MSLLPAFNGEVLPGRTLYFEHQAARAVIQGDWKAVWGKRMPHENPRGSCTTSRLTEARPRTSDNTIPGIVRRLADYWEAYASQTGIHVETR